MSVICRWCGFLVPQKNIISSRYSSLCFCFLILAVYQPKLRISMHKLVDHVKAKHKVTPNHSISHGAFPRCCWNTSLFLGTEVTGVITPGSVSCCASQSTLVSVFSSSFICVYERALHRWVKSFYLHFSTVWCHCIRKSNYFYQQDCDSHHILWKFSSMKL